MWQYRATVDRVVDGDTIDVTIDLGFRVYTTQRLRLRHIDTPEKYGPGASAAGVAAAQIVEQMLPVGTKVIVETEKTGKYGRWLAIITLPDGVELNAWLVEKGYAERSES